jgi:hypothetical protein
MSTILNLLNGKGDIIISSCYFINKQSYAETARHKINKWSKGLWFLGPCSSKYVAIGKKSKLV